MIMKKVIVWCVVCALFMANGLFARKSAGYQKEEVNIYTHRHYDVDKKLFNKFTELTGIKVNVVKARADQLIERLKSEGDASPADILCTVDAGRLHKAKEQGLLQPITSEVLEKNIPAHLRDKEGYWYGFTKRARVIVYHKDRVSPDELLTYEDLTDPKWKGRIVVRSSSNIYNQSLLASLIAVHGEEKALEWAKGVVTNMARSPKGNDRDQMKAIAAGIADIAIVNTYYLGLLLHSENPEEVKVGQQMGVVFPNQDGRGTHINISGAGVTKGSKNRDNAIKLLDFLSDTEAQKVFAQANYEYPVHVGVAPSETVAVWGTFTEDMINLAILGEKNSQAVVTFDYAGWK